MSISCLNSSFSLFGNGFVLIFDVLEVGKCVRAVAARNFVKFG